jgi:hypothetical protein
MGKRYINNLKTVQKPLKPYRNIGKPTTATNSKKQQLTAIQKYSKTLKTAEKHQKTEENI